MQNTSLTMKDIMDMSLPQLEFLLEGISKNNKAQQDAMDGVQEGSAADLVQYLEQNGGAI